METLRLGDRGFRVRALQTSLGIKIDGIFGNNTLKAVKAFQARSSIAVDGIAGPITRGMILGDRASQVKASVGNLITPKFKAPRACDNTNSALTKYTLGDTQDLSDNLMRMFKQNAENHDVMMLGLNQVIRHIDQLKISNLIDLSYFMGQTRQEIGYRMKLTENLYYSADALPKIFSYYRQHRNEARADGYHGNQAAKPMVIANKVYANRYGNGNVPSGDGWKYRGMGFAHTTFKYNCEVIQEAYESIKEDNDFQHQVNFVKDTNLRSDPQFAMYSGMLFWLASGAYRNISNHTKVTRAGCDSVTKIYNKHTTSYPERWKFTQKFARILGVPYEK